MNDETKKENSSLYVDTSCNDNEEEMNESTVRRPYRPTPEQCSIHWDW